MLVCTLDMCTLRSYVYWLLFVYGITGTWDGSQLFNTHILLLRVYTGFFKILPFEFIHGTVLM